MQRKNTIRNGKFLALATILATAAVSMGVVIDFTGGTAFLQGGGAVVTNDTVQTENVDYYVESGFMVDFINGGGLMGNYYSAGNPSYDNSVAHAHHVSNDQMSLVFSRVDGAAFDLQSLNLTSNTVIGGGTASGQELTFITTNTGNSMLLPSSDWGVDFLSTGEPGDGIKTVLFGDLFKGITSFTISSENAYCVGLTDFTAVPEPATMTLLGLGAVLLRRRK